MFRTFDMTFRFMEATPLAFQRNTDTPASELALSTGPKNPAEFLASFEDVWATIALEGLVQFWGPAIAVELLDDEEHGVRAYSLLCSLGGFAAGECLPFEYNAWRAWYDNHYPA